MKYQLFPNLTADEMDALTSDIRDRGIMVPVEVDENGDILDGHHRAMIADSLGIEYPKVVRAGWSEDQKLVHVVALNAHRRQLSAVERADVVGRLRQERLSTRAIAKAVGTSEATVRRDLSIATSDAMPDTISTSDGRTYPAFRPRVDPNPDPYFAERAAAKKAAEPDALQVAATAIADAPEVQQADSEYRAAVLIRDLTRARNAADPKEWADRLIAEDVEAFLSQCLAFERWVADWRTALSRPLRVVGGKS